MAAKKKASNAKETSRAKKATPSRQTRLFDLGPPSSIEPTIKRLRHPVWTENKAKLIQTYLRLFVLVTKNGVYIDGFAGPQEPGQPEMWAAKLVLEITPRWFRKFYFFELEKPKVAILEQLKAAQPPKARKEAKRTIMVFSGDVNERIGEVLSPSCITQKAATFCLLDQRTFECEWATVERVARYKQGGQHKIEISTSSRCRGWTAP